MQGVPEKGATTSQSQNRRLISNKPSERGASWGQLCHLNLPRRISISSAATCPFLLFGRARRFPRLEAVVTVLQPASARHHPRDQRRRRPYILLRRHIERGARAGACRRAQCTPRGNRPGAVDIGCLPAASFLTIWILEIPAPCYPLYCT
jgi:hypothetical protein